MYNNLQVIFTMTSVYSFGQGSLGQLGHGEEDDQTKPKFVTELRNTRVIKLACGARHSAAITDNGVLFTWGSNEDGGMFDSITLLLPLTDRPSLYHIISHYIIISLYHYIIISLYHYIIISLCAHIIKTIWIHILVLFICILSHCISSFAAIFLSSICSPFPVHPTPHSSHTRILSSS